MIKKIYLFDLDSTLTREELLPRIAKLNNTHEKLRELTNNAMLSRVDFQESFRQRVSILAEIPLEQVQETVRTVPLLEELMKWIKGRNNSTFVVTGNLDIWVKTLLEDNFLNSYSSTASIRNSRVEIDEVLEKEKVIEDFNDDFTIFVGDGSNDVSLMSLTDVGILTEIVHDSPSHLWDVADYAVKDEETLCRLLSRL
jgi:HAD superfamily phosphoserine phosphatase-like hydrolase